MCVRVGSSQADDKNSDARVLNDVVTTILKKKQERLFCEMSIINHESNKSKAGADW